MINENQENQENSKSISGQTQKKFKIDKKHIQGFVAGILVATILFTGIWAGINPDFLKGTFTNQVGDVALENEIDMQDVTASPANINATNSIDTSFVLDIPTDKLNKVNDDDLYLWGFFKDMKVTEVTEENGKLKVNVEGTPQDTNSYDSDTNNDDGYISIFGDAVKEKEIGYTATVSITYPRFTSVPKRLEENTAYDTDVALTLTGDTFVKTPSPEDINLDGIFKGMELSNLSQKDNKLSFHVKGKSSDSGYNGYIGISKDVLKSGLSAEKIIPVDGTPTLYSITPVTVEAPFEDTLVLRISNDFFTEKITPDMFELGDGLKKASVSKVEYIDNMSVYLTICGDEIREAGMGTITLSSKGLQSKRKVTAKVEIKKPSISMKNGNEEILAAAKGKENEYKLTIFSEGNDFMSYITKSDFVLKGVLSKMKIKGVKWINGYRTELTLVGAPTAGKGVVSVRSKALGGITGAECSVNVTKTADLYGHVNLSDALSKMTISFYDKDGNTLKIPTAKTDKDGNFSVTLTPGMPVDSIAFLEAKNDKMELRAPFHWDERKGININAFTTLMEDTIAKSETEEGGIQKVYRYLKLEDNGLTSTNYRLSGKNTIFSHKLFETQAKGDVNGYIKQLEDEMQSGKNRSFKETTELTGETGGLFADIIDWGLGKVKDAAVSGIKSAISEGAKTGLIYILRETGILGPSTEEMLEELQESIDALSDQVRTMQDLLSQEIKEAELQGMMNNLGTQLEKITSLNEKYLGRKTLIENEIATYKANHPNDTQTNIASELPRCEAFFGPNGEIARADLYSCITNIINILNAPHVGKPLISVYYDVLKGRLPFEHNAGEELYYFIKYVTDIETTGLQLYSSYCLYNGDPDLEADLNTLTNTYAKAIVDQEQGNGTSPALLPNSSIFSVKNKYGTDKVTVKCNYNGKYYSIPDSNRTMKDDLIEYSSYYISYCTRESCADTKDFEDLFHYRELYYSGMSSKNYLSDFGGCRNLPDWFTYKFGKMFFWFFSGQSDIQITFYDTADNVYRDYFASDLYRRYGNWNAKVIKVYNW